jgi:hypothetical protein
MLGAHDCRKFLSTQAKFYITFALFMTVIHTQHSLEPIISVIHYMLSHTLRFYIHFLIFTLLNYIQLDSVTPTSWFHLFINMILTMVLLSGCSKGARCVINYMLSTLDTAPPWNINKIPILYYPRHYRKHG